MTSHGQEGRTLAELVVALACSALLLGSAAAALAPAGRGRAVDAATRGLATHLRALALEAVTDGRARAIVFPTDADEPFAEARDGDGDGLSRRDVQDGIDVRLARYALARDFPDVEIGIPAWPGLRDLPPGGGPLDAGEPAVRFGRARMAVLTPEGHATPGSLFVTDGETALCALVINGATARVQAWCWDRGAARWRRR
ncbi:MAG: hypothetical protein KBD01_12980 [Acidobacteria bacterium]|nr:hypothetical protein [Acidobacteriota bacterium]